MSNVFSSNLPKTIGEIYPTSISVIPSLEFFSTTSKLHKLPIMSTSISKPNGVSVGCAEVPCVAIILSTLLPVRIVGVFFVL